MSKLQSIAVNNFGGGCNDLVSDDGIDPSETTTSARNIRLLGDRKAPRKGYMSFLDDFSTATGTGIKGIASYYRQSDDADRIICFYDKNMYEADPANSTSWHKIAFSSANLISVDTICRTANYNDWIFIFTGKDQIIRYKGTSKDTVFSNDYVQDSSKFIEIGTVPTEGLTPKAFYSQADTTLTGDFGSTDTVLNVTSTSQFPNGYDADNRYLIIDGDIFTFTAKNKNSRGSYASINDAIADAGIDALGDYFTVGGDYYAFKVAAPSSAGDVADVLGAQFFLGVSGQTSAHSTSDTVRGLFYLPNDDNQNPLERLVIDFSTSTEAVEVSKVVLRLGGDGNAGAADDITYSIYAAAGAGNPTGDALGSGTILYNAIGGGYDKVNLEFTAPILLADGSDYCIVLECVPTTDSPLRVYVEQAGSYAEKTLFYCNVSDEYYDPGDDGDTTNDYAYQYLEGVSNDAPYFEVYGFTYPDQPATKPASISSASDFTPSFGIVSKGSLWVGGVPIAPNTIFLSKPALVGTESAIYDFSGTLGAAGGADAFLFPTRVTAIREMGDVIVIFTQTGAYFAQLTDAGTFVVKPISGAQGCLNQECAVNVESDIFYLTPQHEIKSVSRVAASSPTGNIFPESKKINNFMKETLGADQVGAFGYYDQEQKLIKFFVREEGISFPNYCIVGDLKNKSTQGIPWLIDEGKAFSCATFFNGKSYTGDAFRGKIYTDEVGYSDDDAPIHSIWETKSFTANNPMTEKRFHIVSINGDIGQYAEASATVYVDDKIVKVVDILGSEIYGTPALGIGTSAIGDTAIGEENDAIINNYKTFTKHIVFRSTGKKIRVEIETNQINCLLKISTMEYKFIALSKLFNKVSEVI